MTKFNIGDTVRTREYDFCKKFLDNPESYKLFCKKVFTITDITNEGIVLGGLNHTIWKKECLIKLPEVCINNNFDSLKNNLLNNNNNIHKEKINEKIDSLYNETVNTLNEVNDEFIKQIDSKKLSRDNRPLEVKLSIKGKIDKLKKQKEIVRRQNEKPEWSFEDYEKFVEENSTDENNYSSTSYYMGSLFMNDSDHKFTDDDKYNKYITEENIEKEIKQLENVIGLKHLKENIKVTKQSISISEIKAKINRTYFKHAKRNQFDQIGNYKINIDLEGLRKTLILLSPDSVPLHNRFIYSLCRYVDKYAPKNPTMINETISAIKYLDFGNELEQNKEIVESLNEIYERFRKK